MEDNFDNFSGNKDHREVENARKILFLGKMTESAEFLKRFWLAFLLQFLIKSRC